MTSWKQGKETENKGNQDMNSSNWGEKAKGVGEKAAGDTEQGINNVGDTLSGKQSDLQGHDRNTGAEAGEWVEHRGDDMKNASR